MDLSLPLVFTPSALVKTPILGNHINTNMTNETNFNEDRNSVTCSEDSGISSSNGDEILSTTNTKDNQPSHSISRPMSSPYYVNTTDTVESRSKPLILTKTNQQHSLVNQILRPNSASSDLSNISETENLDVPSHLIRTEDKIPDFDQKVSTMKI